MHVVRNFRSDEYCLNYDPFEIMKLFIVGSQAMCASEEADKAIKYVFNLIETTRKGTFTNFNM